jgi:protoheme IX farnesyltransferase
MIKDDYALAEIPMLPVVKGVIETKRSILIYTLALVALTLMLPATGAVGWFYFASSSVLGGAYIYYSWRLYKRPEILGARSAYLFSLLYLALLFAAVAGDVFIRF